MWLQVATQPDLAFSVNKLACFVHNPGKVYQNALKHILTYIKGAIGYGITYKGGESLKLYRYVNSNYARCKGTRWSTEGNIFMVARGLVSWKNKRQNTVLFTVEAKYMTFMKAIT